MELFGVDELDWGAWALHLHDPLPRPHSVQHPAASECPQCTDCASKLVVPTSELGPKLCSAALAPAGSSPI